MAGTERTHASHEDRRPDDEPEGPEVPTAPQAQSRDAEVDALLEEIDEVLETNAESFVRGFVQKGGE
ncbi:ubiquitin-like protein Pup [Cellulosimicrobium composti]|uniref:Prokaryotic ubiquitin-like protein Pup n=1 Tax=Cellulosimicrobium composti TaxID=2672572 RepID=A0A6N7ZIP3_9MICO|nr:ubiquitin-like protein Pup [Cellulosimicrobium composti]MTG89374.1 ubiquitin-like protein Pup [Cellulosimicrobium composti]NDO87937.1 ubiquitin-like protein Pup [Cellulosimicrobium composti]TWG87184.1 ubiquitin-like protein Pup [Cellulosimicrobium cellulans J34]SMF20670.1 prokaryotic ubiquitin-like protein Pup [Cellulosimicrobium cellulans J1]